MKPKWLIIAAAPLVFSGCFSTVERLGEAGYGADHSARRKAAALDVVTLPIQAPLDLALILEIKPGFGPPSQKELEKDRHLMSLLEKDPEIALKERWDRVNSHPQARVEVKPDYARRHVFIASFSNPNVKYTQDQIETIYQVMPAVSDYVFSCRTCSKEFLASHFDEAYKTAASHTSYDELASIVSNPNTPIELVEKVASAKNLPGGATGPAYNALRERRLNAAIQPTTNAPSVSP